MWPVLFTIRLFGLEIPINTYGLLIAIGFIVGVQSVRIFSKREKLNPDLLADLSFWLLMGGFLGARTLFVITRWDYFVEYPLEVFKVWQGGLVFFGGLIASTGIAVWFFIRHKLKVWKSMDAMVAGLTVAHAFGRLGCLGAGCCHGSATDMPWGIKLGSDLVESSLRNVPIHPTQLYESFSLFILFFVLNYVSKRKQFDGQVAMVYFMGYPVIRSIVEIYRGDTIRGFVIGDWLSTSQFISILVFAAALIFSVVQLKKVNSSHAKKK